MYKNSKFQLTALSAAIASTLISSYAIGQNTIREEVIVTATRRSESIQDIPINITAIGGSMIERDRLSNLTEIARRVPGMTVIDQGPRSGNVLTVRGLNVDALNVQDGVNSGGNSVGTYIGEIPVYIDLKLNDMDRIEVLIGPQGTLYGAGTLGGAIRFIPNKPQADIISGQIRGDFYDLSKSDSLGGEGGATINIPIIEDKLAVRASIDYLDDPGFIDYNFLVREAGVSIPQPDFSNPADVRANLTRKTDANTEETLSGRFAVRYTGDILDGTLSYYYQDMEIGGRQNNHREAFNTGKYESAYRFAEPNDRNNQLVALELAWDLGFAELIAAGGYSEYEEQGQRDQTDLLLTFETGYELFPSFAAFTREEGEEERLNVEVRLVSTSDGPFSWIIGAFYNDLEEQSLSQEFTPGFGEFAVANLGGEQSRPDALEYNELITADTEEIALFGEIGYQITDAWQITLGARYFEFTAEQSTDVTLPLLDALYFGGDPVAVGSDIQENDVEEDDVLFKFNTSYHFNDDVMGYLTISEGYRLGNLNSVGPCPDPLPAIGENVCALPDEILIESDTTTNYELGIHSQIGDSAIVNASLFFIDWEKVQVADTTDNGNIPITTNGGSAESSGLEIAAQFFITPELSISGSYAYTKAELAEDADDLVNGEKAFDGDRLPGTPEHQVYLSANYILALNDGSEVNFDWNMTAQSDVYTQVGNRSNGEELAGFALHNVSATWQRDSWTAALYADNVFNRYAETGVRQDDSFVRAVEGIDLRRYAHDVVRPRQIGIRFTYDFED